ncbi:BEN domain-containing protein 5-like isoform X2 [Ornithodoros turicata]|uniref:BEN domain-containing protein 5-like isoform X2 n=1 Tax=Ornithodoros turicata TaxID=34597 RepID=UPI0031395A0E
MFQVDIRYQVQVGKMKRDRVLAQEEDSMFLKEGMVAIWGTAILNNRTVAGKLSNKAKANGQTEVSPALTPRKLDALKGAYGAVKRRSESQDDITK